MSLTLTPRSSPDTSPALDLAIRSASSRPSGWELAWAQRAGVRHHVCEDSVGMRTYAVTPGRLHAHADVAIAVCDGVGGGARGDVASHCLARHCTTDLPQALLYGGGGRSSSGLAAWVKLADAQVQHALRQVTFEEGASTLVAAWFRGDGRGWLHHVGDSRAYLCRRRPASSAGIALLTRDHTYASTLEEPPSGARPDDPSRMVGNGLSRTCDWRPLHLQAGDTLLLCSDGLHKWVCANTMLNALDLPHALETQARDLAQRAWAAGSHDDITVLLARYQPDGSR